MIVFGPVAYAVTISAVIWILGIVFAVDQNIKLRKQISDFRHRNPTEVDLELATHEQIMLELRKRPLRYMFIIPKFHVEDDEINFPWGGQVSSVSVEVSGLSQAVAKDVISKACSAMCGIDEGLWEE